jgi:hypothetical protein
LPSAFVTSSGFAYPPDVLLPVIPSKLFFKLTALLGFSPSKLIRLMRSENISAVTYPPAVHFMLDTNLGRYGHINRDFWVLILNVDLGISKYGTCLLPIAPVEFSFLGSAVHRSCSFSGIPLVCLALITLCGIRAYTSEYLSTGDS